MRQIEGNPAEAGDALRAVLQVMALEPEGQLALFPEPEECVTCRISFQYDELLARYRKAPFFRGLDKARATVLKRLEEAATRAGEVPCHEPERLEGPGFVALRREATVAL